MKRMSEWLVMKSPARLAEERAEALQEAARASRAAAKASEQGRLDMYERAVHLKQAGDELLALLRQSQELSAGGVARVGQDVQSVGRKVDGLHESVETFLALAADGALGPGLREELREALAAVQSVNLVGQDVRTLSKQVDALRDVVVTVLEGEQPPGSGYMARHRRPDGEGRQETAPEAEEQEITGPGPGQTGLSPEEEARRRGGCGDGGAVHHRRAGPAAVAGLPAAPGA